MTRAACDKAALRRGDFALADSVLRTPYPVLRPRLCRSWPAARHARGHPWRRELHRRVEGGRGLCTVTYSSTRGTPRAAPEAGAEGPVRPARTNAAGSARLQHVPITLEPEARKQSSAAATVGKVAPFGRPEWAKGNARGAHVKGWGGRGCAGTGRSTIAAAGCRGRGACGSGCGRARAVLVRPFHVRLYFIFVYVESIVHGFTAL